MAGAASAVHGFLDEKSALLQKSGQEARRSGLKLSTASLSENQTSLASHVSFSFPAASQPSLTRDSFLNNPPQSHASLRGNLRCSIETTPPDMPAHTWELQPRLRLCSVNGGWEGRRPIFLFVLTFLPLPYSVEMEALAMSWPGRAGPHMWSRRPRAVAVAGHHEEAMLPRKTPQMAEVLLWCYFLGILLPSPLS